MSMAASTEYRRPTIVDAYLTVRRWWLLGVAVVFLTTAASVAIALWLPPTYRSTMLLAPAETLGQSNSSGGMGALGALRALGAPQNSRSDEALAILRSERFIGEFIARYDLLPQLFAEDRDPATGRWKGKPPVAEDGVKLFLFDVLGVSVDDETGFVRVSIDWRDPAVGQNWANWLIRDLNAEIRNRATAEARADLSFLQARLSQATVQELRLSLVELIRNRMETAMLAANRPNYAFKILDPASVSKYRYQPRRTLIVGLGIIVGVLLSLAVIAFAETVRRMRAHLPAA